MLARHDVSTAYELGWSTRKNGELLADAEIVFEGITLEVEDDIYLARVEAHVVKKVEYEELPGLA